jgi:polar amino acid transport system permease protein
MDWGYIIKYIPMYGKAALLTVRIGATGIVLSLAIGIFCAVVRQYKIPVFNRIVKIYIELSRNTPLLIQLFLLYFGFPKIGIKLSGETCAVIGLAFLGGSYMAEAFRSGLSGVENIQYESALSLGLTKWQTMQYVLLPQAISRSVPAITANMIFLIKETSVFSIIALPDLMYVAKDLIGLDYKTYEALSLLVVFYIIILLPISVGASFLERRVRRAGFEKPADSV